MSGVVVSERKYKKGVCVYVNKLSDYYLKKNDNFVIAFFNSVFFFIIGILGGYKRIYRYLSSETQLFVVCKLYKWL